jgi:hypothetical protein
MPRWGWLRCRRKYLTLSRRGSLQGCLLTFLFKSTKALVAKVYILHKMLKSGA